MALSRQQLRTFPSCAVVLTTCQAPALGLALSAVRDGGLDYLLLQSRLDPGHAMLLPAGARTPVCGLATFSRLGRLHARRWALVWGPGAPQLRRPQVPPRGNQSSCRPRPGLGSDGRGWLPQRHRRPGRTYRATPRPGAVLVSTRPGTEDVW